MASDNNEGSVVIPFEVGPAIQILVGAFSLEALTRLSKGLSAVVATLTSCVDTDVSINGHNVEPLPSIQPIHRSRVSLTEKAAIVDRRQRGETQMQIADALGRSVATVSNVIAKAKKAGGEGGAK